MKCSFWTGGPFTWSMSGCIYIPYPALKPHTHTVTIWTRGHQHTLQLFLNTPKPLHLLFIFPNHFVFPCSIHLHSTAATLFLYFPSSICAHIISEACNEPDVYFSYYWLLQLRLLFPTGAGKMFLLSPPLLRHDSKTLHNSVLVITHPSKVPPGTECKLWDNCNPFPSAAHSAVANYRHQMLSVTLWTRLSTNNYNTKWVWLLHMAAKVKLRFSVLLAGADFVS